VVLRVAGTLAPRLAYLIENVFTETSFLDFTLEMSFLAHSKNNET
jgi:hypothetical protein